jgi:phage/plasmid-like protein (TIGR03299 family)
MAHQYETGFQVRRPAWHGLGLVLDDYPGSWDEARRLAGLDWEPVEEQVYARRDVTGGVPDLTTDPETGMLVAPENPLEPVDGFKIIRRSDTGAVLNVANDTYGVFPNADLGPLVEAICSEPDVQYETAGVLDGGRKVWVMVKLRTPFEVPGDPKGATLSRLAIQNSHDGSTALRAQRLQTRIVCANTSTAADREASKHGLQFTFRHSTNIRDRVEDAKAALDGLRSDRQAYVEWAHDLLGITVTPAQRELWLAEFVPTPEVASDRVIANVEQVRDEIRTILASETTRDTAHTAYGLTAAAIEWLDHDRTYRSEETKFSRSIRREPLKAKAEKIAREVALV